MSPLSAEEITEITRIVRASEELSPHFRFISFTLHEPPKEFMRSLKRGDVFPREAEVILIDEGSTYELLVDIAGQRIRTFKAVPGVQASIPFEECIDCERCVKAYPPFQEALRKRGITDMDRVLVEAWAFGAHLLPEPYTDRRLGWADVWYRSEPGSNPYANPVTGLHLVVDLNAMELLEVEDTGAIEEPATMGEYIPGLVPGLQLRTDVRPLEISQPSGP